MNAISGRPAAEHFDTGLLALCGIASFFRIASDPGHLKRELALLDRDAGPEDLVRAARIVGLKARVIGNINAERLRSMPLPAIVQMNDGHFAVFVARSDARLCRFVDPITKI